jgi:hypothetical protein
MKHHGYQFTAEMVRAILAGPKTETRRVVTWANSLVDGTGKGIRDKWERLDWSNAIGCDGGFEVPYKDRPIGRMNVAMVTPRVQPGDLAYVKETWQLMRHLDPYRFSKAWDVESKNGVVPLAIRYDADGEVRDPRNIRGLLSGWKWGKTRPSVLMPKDVSRAWLPVVSVGSGFVQDITEAEAQAEGAPAHPGEGKTYATTVFNPSYRVGFKHLWTSINGDDGPKSWDANPPVWVPRWTEVRDRP